MKNPLRALSLQPLKFECMSQTISIGLTDLKIEQIADIIYNDKIIALRPEAGGTGRSHGRTSLKAMDAGILRVLYMRCQ